MKKIFKLLIITLLLAPVVVFADMGAPVIREFEAEVIADKLVVKGYNKTFTFKKGEKIIITGSGENYQVLYKNDYYDIAKEDIVAFKPVNSNVGPNESNINKLEKSREFEVIVDSLDVYSGPATVYDKVGRLQYGDQVTAYYGASSDQSFSDYFYIQEESLKGWIYIGSNNFNVWEINQTNLKAMVVKDIQLNGVDLKANEIEKIYYWANPFISSDPVIKLNGKFTTFKEYGDFVLISEGKKIATSFKDSQINFELTKDVKVYETLASKEEMATIPAGTKLSSVNLVDEFTLYGDYEYKKGEYEAILVFYNNKLGWIKVTNKEAKLIEGTELVLPYKDIEGDDDTEITTSVVEEEEKEKSLPIDRKQVTIISVIVAVSLAIMAFSSIIILNKKNKKDTLKEINDELEKTKKIDNVKKTTEDK